MIVDSHCHASSRWYEPVDTLLFNMDRCAVDRAILVQLLGSTDSRDMIAACRAHRDRFAFIGAIDPDAADASELVDRAVQEGAAGLRMKASWRSPGDDPLALWRRIEANGLRVSMAGPASDFLNGNLDAIMQACPRLVVLLEHAGGLARPDAGDRAALLPGVCALARYPNLAIKIPGLGQIAPRLPDLDREHRPLDLSKVHALLDPLVVAFGGHRLLWGSDFPPVAAREGYANALNWTREVFAEHWPESVPDCFGGTAQRLFALT